ncbi:MAG: phosphoribosylanthranilate isomerase [Lachnospiraceae bacterium]|nr:phosphoribosylanthranilate isomerase [Lachnospiraceae bacterium]
MTKIKLCGLRGPADIEAVNELQPDCIGFVFWEKSRRSVTPETALKLKGMLDQEIKAVGVFVDEQPEKIAELVKNGIIDIIQLHGSEDEAYIRRLRALTDVAVIKAFRIRSAEDVKAAAGSSADYIMLDSGKGTGMRFNWSLIGAIRRLYFLAGGLDAENVSEAIRYLHPYAVDVSSGIETDGVKDRNKMAAFVSAVRKEERR